MKTAATRRILASTASAIFAAAPAVAQDKPPVPIQISAEAKPFVDKEIEIAKGLKSLRGSNKQVWQVKTGEREYPPMDQPLDYAVAKPDRLFLENRQMKVYADGANITVYQKFLKHYIVVPQPEPARLREAIELASGRQIVTIPGELVLNPAAPMDKTFRNVRSFDQVRRGEFEGKPGTWVTGTSEDPSQPSKVPITFGRWYSDEDHLVHHVDQDWAGMYQEISDRNAAEDAEAGNEPAKPTRTPASRRTTTTADAEAGDEPAKPTTYLQVGWSIDFNRELNPDLPSETFAFTPGPEDKKVEEFIFPRPNLKEQIAMIGHPCPEIAGQDFDGRTVDVAAYKGKVVVMDFWATWCGPCCAGLPSMQMIKTKYADKPFVMIGVNRDHEGDGPKARRYLAKRGLDIQQLDDIAGTAAEKFYVNSIPCVVILDTKGNVADIDVGYLPGKENELMAKLDKMFAGQPLRTPEEIKKLRAQVGVEE